MDLMLRQQGANGLSLSLVTSWTGLTGVHILWSDAANRLRALKRLNSSA